jgi:hypothetical protein
VAFTSRDSVQDFYDIAKAHQNHKELKINAPQACAKGQPT